MKNKTRKTKRGGRFYGKGAYGAVMGDPRMPCPDEKLDDIQHNNEIGKIIFKERAYNEEILILHRLEEVLSSSTIETLRNYFVLPVKHCTLDKDHTFSYPIYKSAEWGKDKDGETPHDFVYKPAYNAFKFDNVISNTMFQVVYPRGEHDVFEDIIYMSSEPTRAKVSSVLFKFGNLFTGLQLLHKQNMVHMDIKLENAISIDGTYKFIDLAQATQITREEDKPINKDGFIHLLNWIKRGTYYFAWPSLIIYAKPYLEGSTDLIYSDFFTDHFSSHNTHSLSHTLDRFHIIDEIIKSRKFGMSDELAKDLYEKYVSIVIFRFFGLSGRTSDTDFIKVDLDKIHEIILYMRSHSSKKLSFFESAGVPDFIKYAIIDTNLFVRSINEELQIPDERYLTIRMDYILKSCDLYSMGGILLDYLSSIHTDMGINNTLLNLFNYALKIMSISVPTDWNRYNKATYFDDVYKEYADIVKKLVPTRRTRSRK